MAKMMGKSLPGYIHNIRLHFNTPERDSSADLEKVRCHVA